QLTNCSRGIHNAWHFYYALILVIKVVCSGLGIDEFWCWFVVNLAGVKCGKGKLIEHFAFSESLAC
uniref:hypothetical protein n=1 Tax=Vibrio sp. V01_P9A10T6 TaxID=2116368 RepID=UPI0028059749